MNTLTQMFQAVSEISETWLRMFRFSGKKKRAYTFDQLFADNIRVGHYLAVTSCTGLRGWKSLSAPPHVVL